MKMFILVCFHFQRQFTQCSKAADQLTKKAINPEIESDYERVGDENRSKKPPRKTSLFYCQAFLIPFSF